MSRADYDSMMCQLQSQFNDIVAQLQYEREQHRRDVRLAWDEIARERDAVTQLRREAEAARAEASLWARQQQREGRRGGAASSAWTVMPSSEADAAGFGSAGSGGRGNADVAGRRAAASPRGSHTGSNGSSGGWEYQREHRQPAQRSQTPQAGRRGAGTDPRAALAPCWITVWPGHSRNAVPRRLLVPAEMTFAQLVEKAAVEVNCRPVPRVLYTPDGRTISDRDSVPAGVDVIVIPAGSRYNEDTVPTLLLEKLIGVVDPLAVLN